MASLLPDKSDHFEMALEASLASRWNDLGVAAEAIRTAKLVAPPPSFLPFLVYEYGLGELTPYVPNLYTLVVDREGVNWQRIRGTPAAVSKGLGWLGYSATMEDAWHGRAYWNSTQLRFPVLPANDNPDLERIEGVTRLSMPLRSRLRRGVHQYDVGALEADGSRLDDSMLDRESGVAVTAAGTLWSFGRTTEIDHLLAEAEGTAIGNWIAVPEEGGLKWVDMQYPWVTANFLWADNPATQRRALMAAWFVARVHYVTFRDQGGVVIGHRRCRADQAVRQEVEGVYEIGGVRYQPRPGATRVYLEAMTDFEDAFDVEAKSIELTVGATVAPDTKPGRLWLQSGELVGGHPIAITSVSLPLRKTVREQIKILMRF
ncbi:Phage protein Gp27 [Neorhizobium galegae bv. orientalis]|nr:Phage protein Gp27 [Neorhizobium galegae bv. orientalis]